MAEMKPGLLPGSPTYDCVISCPVYTQLVYTQIEVLLKILYAYDLYQYEDLNRILTVAHHGMATLIKKYNQLILSFMKTDGILVVLSDILEMAADDPFLAQLKIDLKGPEIKREIELKIDENGLVFARTGLENLRDQICLTDSVYCLWPFDENKEYLVHILAGRGHRLPNVSVQ